MAKPDKPLLSLGAKGTISDSLTFQKRGKATMVRRKPIPENPRSQAQLAQRQLYRDAIDAWHALSAEEKEAWRGVCPGLSPYHCFMRSELKYAPPPLPIDIGSEAIDRPSGLACDYTYVDKNNPANATGLLDTLKVYCAEWIYLLIVATYYLTGENKLKCRDSQYIGDVTSGSVQTFTGLSVNVQEGDYIGCYLELAGVIEADTEGFAGVWSFPGDCTLPGKEETFSFLEGHAISLYGTGQAP